MKQTGRAEVERLKRALDATFQRAKRLPSEELELRSDFARFLCIRVSGFLEKAIAELLTEHARRNGAPTLLKYVESQVGRSMNLNAAKLKDLVGSFDSDWRLSLETILVGEKKDAVDSIVGLRNRIAHGQDVSVTYSRVWDYYKEIQHVLEAIARLCAPV